MNFTSSELTDIVLCFGEARQNSYEARRIYSNKFPNRRLPNRKTFFRTVQRLRESGSFKGQYQNGGRNRHVRTANVEEEVLTVAEQNPRISSRRLGLMTGISHQSVLNIFHEQQLKPFHIQPVQALHENDPEARIRFSTWFNRKCAENREFPRKVLVTDEAIFTKNGMYNIHNEHQ